MDFASSKIGPMYILGITVHKAKSNDYLIICHAPQFALKSKLTLFVDLKNKWHLVLDRLTVLFLKFLEYFHKLQLFIWWLLEIHVIKIVSSYIVLMSVTEVTSHFTPSNSVILYPLCHFGPNVSEIEVLYTRAPYTSLIDEHNFSMV